MFLGRDGILKEKEERSSWKFRIYYTTYVVAGLFILFLSVDRLPAGHWQDIFIFVLLIIIADFVQIPLPRGGSTISTASPIDLAGIVLFGPAVMVVVEAISSIFTEGVLQRRSLRKLLFNVPLLAFTVGAAGLAYQLFGDYADIDSPMFLLPLFAAGIVYYLVNTWSLSLIIAFDSGRKPYHVWKQNYMWYFFHIFAFLPMGAIIALLYARAGGWTIALFIIPLFLARYSFQLYLDMREKNIETVAALTSAIDASDAFTHGHSYRVSQYATRIAKAMGMSSKEIETLEYASLLHDVGKIAVSNSVLQKVEPLTEEEWMSLRAHPDVGADIVERLKFLKEAAEIIRCHHERPDGTGYPRGLKGDQIPLGAHILNVVDAFDAMTSDRPYREALPAEIVINELSKHRGTQFHREVADLVLGMYRSGELDPIIGSKITPGIYDSLKETIQV